MNRTRSLLWGSLFCSELSFIWPLNMTRLCTRFFTSVIFTITLQTSVIIMFTLQMGKLSTSLHRWKEAELGVKPWSVGLEPIFCPQHTVSFTIAPGGGGWKAALCKHLLPHSLRDHCHVWPGAWHLWAWSQLQWDFASIRGWAGWACHSRLCEWMFDLP